MARWSGNQLKKKKHSIVSWGDIDAIKQQLESAINMSGEAREYAMALVKQLNYISDIQKNGVVKATPFMGVGRSLATQGDYCMISLEVVRKIRLVVIYFGVLAAYWTLMIFSRAWVSLSRTTPVYSSKGKKKNITGVMLVILVPVVVVMILALILRWTTLAWFWEDAYQMRYFKWIIPATIAFCIFLNFAMGEFVSTLDEDGIYSRRFIGSYRFFPYEKINEYAKTLRPFCDRNYLYIYYGKKHLAFEIASSIGGKAFLKELSEKLNIDYSYFEEQINGDQVKNFRMYRLMRTLEKAERKRLREEKKGRR